MSLKFISKQTLNVFETCTLPSPSRKSLHIKIDSTMAAKATRKYMFLKKKKNNIYHLDFLRFFTKVIWIILFVIFKNMYEWKNI